MTSHQTLHTATVRRVVKANRARVFNAFSNASALKQWFSPSADISIEILQFNFVVGGKYRFRYAMPDGSNPVLGGTYHAIKPPEQLVFTWVWEAPDVHAEIPTQVCVELFEKGDNTEIVLTHRQIPSQEMATRHAAGWEATFDQLEKSIADKEHPRNREKSAKDNKEA